MTGRTHDLAAFAALNYVLILQPLHKMSLATAIIAVGANLIGGLTPDIDQPTADLWHKFPAGSFFGHLFAPLLGGHRYISHSLLGILLFGFLSNYILSWLGKVLLVDMQIVWWSFMIAYLSHLIMDTFTREGVPWLFPLPFKFGFPPFRIFRVKTGSIVEKAIVFPGLIILTGFLYYTHYSKFLDFLRHYIK